MTAQILGTELNHLIQETKRKYTDLRKAAERSLADLEGLGPQTEAQLAQELSNRPSFVTPFLLSCRTKNAKLSAAAVGALQRVIVCKGLNTTRIKDVLNALSEASGLGFDVQLKILQTLPPFIQNYADYLQGDLVGDILVLCATLQASKNAIVNNTAAATLQQLVIPIFDKVPLEDSSSEQKPVAEVPTGSGNVALKRSAFDAYRIFLDLCLLTEGQRAQFLMIDSLPQSSALELIESILVNHADLFSSHPELAHILRTRVMPFVMRSLSEQRNFGVVVRMARILNSLLQKQLQILQSEFEMALGLLTHMLDPEAAPQWKRALCLEIVKGVCNDSTLLRRLYSCYDGVQGKKPILKDLMAALTRMTTEKPTVIGVSTQSTVPVASSAKDSAIEQAAMEAGGVAGIIGGAVGVSEINAAGISKQFSVVRVAFMEQLDKAEPPPMPDSYIYYLALVCVISFSEGLAKFIHPFAISSSDSVKGSRRRKAHAAKKREPTDDNTDSDATRTPSPATGSKRRGGSKRLHVPINPLENKDNPAYSEIQTVARIVETCWPAILASCSTFLYAALDNEFYVALVQSFQKFAHMAGLFRLDTPRDAFMTTLGKAAVPPNVLTAQSMGPPTPTPSDHSGIFSSAKGLLSAETLTTADTKTSTHTMVDPNAQLNSRNLLCLRALLDLGFALGPTLDSAWTIILETLQQADYVLYTSAKRLSRTSTQSKLEQNKADSGSLMANFQAELAAVEKSSTKLFDSTRDFPDTSFTFLLSCLCKLIFGDEPATPHSAAEPSQQLSPGRARTPRSAVQHKRTNSLTINVSSQINENVFALAKMGELAQINLSRLLGPNPDTSGWNLMVDHLIQVSCSMNLASHIRMKAAEVLNEVVITAARVCAALQRDDIGLIQKRLLLALRDEIVTLLSYVRNAGSAAKQTDAEIHLSVLESLNAILEQSGQGLSAGWEIAFEILGTAFAPSSGIEEDNTAAQAPVSRSFKFTRSSFSSLQLICSDFLASLPTPCIQTLIDTVYSFCKQKDDLNISLTTITYFWNISDFLQERGDISGPLTSAANDETELREILKQPDVSSSDLWMYLLLRLTGVSSDPRPEVRNGSIQTLFRIFDTYGDKLSPQAWRPCLTTVVFKMMEVDEGKSQAADKNAWNETINLILGGIGTLYSNYFEIFSKQAEFTHTWKMLIDYFSALFARRSFEVNVMIFRTLSRVLSSVQDPSKLGEENSRLTWEMWSEQGTSLVKEDVEGPSSGIQDTLTAYLSAFQPLYRILSPSISAETVDKAVSLFKDCVLFPDSSSYSSDIDTLVPLQAVVADNLRLINSGVPGLPALYLRRLAEFVTFPYNKSGTLKTSKKGTRPMTYIALSAFAMDLLEKTVLIHADNAEIYTSGAFAEVLSALSLPVTLKYNFQPTLSKSVKKAPSPWVNATRILLSILKQCIPSSQNLDLSDETKIGIASQMVVFNNGIINADCNNFPPTSDDSQLKADEDFDIESFEALRELLTPVLEKEFVPKDVVRNYVVNVYKASILFPEVDDLDEENSENYDWSLRNLGHTEDVRPRRRSKMAYVCFDELFNRVRQSDANPQNSTHLSTLSSSYLLIRCGLVLQNFILDQPLRGSMPQPISRRTELLYTLRNLVDLQYPPQDAFKVVQTSKPLLFKLFPLFTQAMGVSRGDAVITGLLSRVMSAVGGELGITELKRDEGVRLEETLL